LNTTTESNNVCDDATFVQMLREKKKFVKKKGFFKDAYLKARQGDGANLRLAVTLLSSQSYGPKAEKATISLSEGALTKVPPSAARGDYKNGEGVHSEHKFSAANFETGKFNLVQIRLWQDLRCYDFAIFSQDDELFEFRVPKEKVSEMVKEYGNLAHGTKKELKEKGLEWGSAIFKSETALRGVVGGKLWNELLPYRVESLSHL